MRKFICSLLRAAFQLLKTTFNSLRKWFFNLPNTETFYGALVVIACAVIIGVFIYLVWPEKRIAVKDSREAVLAKLHEYRSPDAVEINAHIIHGWEQAKDTLFLVGTEHQDYLVLTSSVAAPKVIALSQRRLDDVLSEKDLRVEISDNLPFSIAINGHGYKLEKGQSIYR